MASISVTKNRLSALLDQVRHGERVLITDRGIPVAMLVQPEVAANSDTDGRLQRLRRAGVISGGGTGRIDLRALGRPERLGGGPDSLSRALQQDRQESR